MKKFKGFTLIELIIVMAILAILMTAIIRMFKPIRETYVDATLFETQRSVQNSIAKYVTESIRFSTDLGIYTSDKTPNVEKAVEAFAAQYLPANGVQTTDSNYNDNVKELKKYAEVIIIDNNPYEYMGRDYNGRILRRKFKKNATTGENEPLTTNAESAGTDECRIALGAAYYGNCGYTIKLGSLSPNYPDDTAIETGDAGDGIRVTVTSSISSSMRSSSVTSSNTGLVYCRNLFIGEHGVNSSPGIFDVSNYNDAVATNQGTNPSKVYIVFLNAKVDIVP